MGFGFAGLSVIPASLVRYPRAFEEFQSPQATDNGRVEDAGGEVLDFSKGVVMGV